MAKKNIRFAQLSFWFSHSNGICANAQRHPNTELVCVWDEDPARGKVASERFGVEFIPDLDTLLKRDDIDAVGICSPTQLHGDHIVAAAEAGKHCLVEKPFTRQSFRLERDKLYVEGQRNGWSQVEDLPDCGNSTAHFVEVVKGNSDARNTSPTNLNGEDGLQSIKVVEAILEAGRTGITVEV